MKDHIRRIVQVARRWGHRVRVLPLRLRGVHVAESVRIFGTLELKRAPGSTMALERGVTLNASVKRNTLEARGPNILQTLSPEAVLRIGEDTGATSVTISAATSVSIGKRVLLGAGVLITDSDHHVVLPPAGQSRRYLGMPTSLDHHSVVIEDDVFVGARAIILKGVTIGQGAVIGAGSVVTKSIPAHVIAGGNPCVVIKSMRGTV